jgi:hypothetical protein
MESINPRTRETHGNSMSNNNNNNNNNTGLVTNSTLQNMQPTSLLRRRGQCGCGSLVGHNERLEYDYSSRNNKKKNVRCRERGEYYIDSYNDLPMSWSFGTHETVRVVGRRSKNNNHANELATKTNLTTRPSTFNLFAFTDLPKKNKRTEYGAISATKRAVSCRPWCGYSCYTVPLRWWR